MGGPLQDVAAAVLAGGLGTRLRPAVADRPKVLAPVGGRPFLTRLLDQLAGASVPEVVLLTGHGAGQVRAALGGEYAGMRLTYSTEPAPLGTAGAVRRALPLLRAPAVLLMNGDSYCELDLDAFGRSHRSWPGGVSLALAHVADASRFGGVHVAPDGRVVRFGEKESGRRPGWVNAGVYFFRRGLLDEIPAGRPVSLEREVLPGWIAAGRVRGFRGGRFIDIGTPESYGEAEAFFSAAVPGGLALTGEERGG
jgi:D-glycero-alpha-D-manno-heptose 1-phosphate guanylyltransferase